MAPIVPPLKLDELHLKHTHISSPPPPPPPPQPSAPVEGSGKMLDSQQHNLAAYAALLRTHITTASTTERPLLEMCLSAVIQATHVHEENQRALEEAKQIQASAAAQVKTAQEEKARVDQDNAILRHKLSMTTPDDDTLRDMSNQLIKAFAERDAAVVTKQNAEAELEQNVTALKDLSMKFAQQCDDANNYLKVIKIYEKHLESCAPALILDLDDLASIIRAQPGDQSPSASVQESARQSPSTHRKRLNASGSLLRKGPTSALKSFKIANLFNRSQHHHGNSERANHPPLPPPAAPPARTNSGGLRIPGGAKGFTLTPRNCNSTTSTAESIFPRPSASGSKIAQTTLTED